MEERPYTTRAKKILTLANAAAENLGDPYIGTKHLLLGMLDERTGIAAQMLTHLGVSRSSIEEMVLQTRSGGPPT